MGLDQADKWLPFLAIGWICLVIGLSVAYRRAVGKPILPSVPGDALYAERWASAPFSSRCLQVAITRAEVTMVPRFPFNLMFLPETYRLERSVPVTGIREVRRVRIPLGNNLVITCEPGTAPLKLRLSDPDQFLVVLGSLLPPAAVRSGW